jgi:hypothetical protein
VPLEILAGQPIGDARLLPGQEVPAYINPYSRVR